MSGCLVAPSVFKTDVAEYLGQAGSIPVRLRQELASLADGFGNYFLTMPMESPLVSMIGLTAPPECAVNAFGIPVPVEIFQQWYGHSPGGIEYLPSLAGCERLR